MKKISGRLIGKNATHNPTEYWGISGTGLNLWHKLDKQAKHDIKNILTEVGRDAKTHSFPYMLRKKLDYIEKDISKYLNGISIEKIKTTSGIAHDLCVKLNLYDKEYFIKYASNESISKGGDLKFNAFKEFATMYMTGNAIQSELNQRLKTEKLDKYHVDIISPLYAHYSRTKGQSVIIYPYIEKTENMIDIEKLEEEGNDNNTVNEIHKIFEKIRYILYPLGVSDTSPQNAFIRKDKDKVQIKIFDTTSKIETNELYEKIQ